MDPKQLEQYKQDVQKVEELSARIEKNGDLAAKKEIEKLVKETELRAKEIAKETLEDNLRKEFLDMQERYDAALDKINFKHELSSVKQSVDITTQKNAPGAEKENKEKDIVLEKVEPTTDLPKEKKNFFGRVFDGVKQDRKDKKYGKLALKATGALAVARAAKKTYNRIKGRFSKEKKESEDKKPWYKRISTWLVAGVGGLALFSQRDSVGDWLKGLFRSKDKVPSSVSGGVADPEAAKKAHNDLPPEVKKKVDKVGSLVFDYHKKLNPDYDDAILNPHGHETMGVTPMLLDGMYDNLDEMMHIGSLHDQKWRKRRESFNGLIAKKSKDAFKYVTDSMLKHVGIGKNHMTVDGLTKEGWTLLDANKDKLRALQSQGFMDTKIYVNHIQGELARSLTIQALKDQGKNTDTDSVNDALSDDDFQEQYVEKKLNDIMKKSSLSDIPSLIQTHSLSPNPSQSLVDSYQKLHKEKKDIIGDTFDNISSQKDIETQKDALLAICDGVIDMTQDEDLREDTDIWYTEIRGQLFGTDDAISDRVRENLGANLRWDSFGQEIQKIQEKIHNNTATVADINNLQILVDNAFSFKNTIKNGSDLMIDLKEKDGGATVNLIEGGEMLFSWTLNKVKDGDGWEIAQAAVGLAPFIIPIRYPITTLRLTGQGLLWVGKNTGSLALQAGATLLQNQIRRFNYRRSQIPGLKYFQLRKYGKTPDTMMKAFRAGFISLDDAATIAAKKSKNTKRNRLLRSKWGNDLYFSDDIANNKMHLLEKTFTHKSANIALLEKHIDTKGWRDILFKGNNSKGETFKEIQQLMQKYDDLLTGPYNPTDKISQGLSPSHKTLLQKTISHNRINTHSLKRILDADFLGMIDLTGMSDQQITQLARKMPKLLNKGGDINRITKQATILKLRALDAKDIGLMRGKLTDILTAHQNKLKNFAGTAAEKKHLQGLVDDLTKMTKMNDAELLTLTKKGFFGKLLHRGKGVVAPLHTRLAKEGSRISQLLKSPHLKTLGKYLGAAASVLEIGFASYDLFLALQDDEELAIINPTKHDLKLQKSYMGLAAASVGGGLMFVPGAGWVVAGAMAAVHFGKEAYYDVMETYTTNLAEFSRQTKPQISNHIISVLSGRSGVDKSWKESFTERWTSKDMDYMGALVGDDAIEGWLRVDEFEHLTQDQQFEIQFHLAPSNHKHEIFASLGQTDISFSNFQKQAEKTFATLIEKPARIRYQAIVEQVGTKEISKKEESLTDSLTGPWSLLGPVGIVGGLASHALGSNTTSKDTKTVLDLSSITTALKNNHQNAHEMLLTLLNGGERRESHENTKQTLPGVYHALRRVATDVFGVNLPYNSQDVVAYFAEGNEDNTGFYFDNKGNFCINHERTIKNPSFPVSDTQKDAHRKGIIHEIERAVKANDLLTLTTGSGEDIQNQDLGAHIVAIFKQTKAQAPT